MEGFFKEKFDANSAKSFFYGEKIFQMDTKEEYLRLLSLRPAGNRKIRCVISFAYSST